MGTAAPRRPRVLVLTALLVRRVLHFTPAMSLVMTRASPCTPPVTDRGGWAVSVVELANPVDEVWEPGQVPRSSGRVPHGAAARLTDHYGAGVERWLSGVHEVVLAAAGLWGVEVLGYHDAGWTSVAAAGLDRTGLPVVIKALPETERFLREQAALRHWAGQGVCRLVDANPACQVLLVEAVGGMIGGMRRPEDHAERVAETISPLHARPVASGAPVPSLTDYYTDTVIPRVRHRSGMFADQVGRERIDRALRWAQELAGDGRCRVMLHSDLYAENVLFDEQERAVFIDPHAKIGSSAFDWAFWCVYYILITWHGPDRLL